MLRSILSKVRGTAATSAPTHAPDSSVTDDLEIPRYPPFRQGLPAVSIDRLLETQKEMVQHFRNELGVEDEIYRAYYEPLIRNYAAYVHLLPASKEDHHAGAGGLLRHGLGSAGLCVHAAERALYGTGEFRSRGKHLEKRWVYATIVGILAHDIGKPADALEVVDESGAHIWTPLTEPLLTWALRNNIQRYYLRWRAGRSKVGHELFSVCAIWHLVPREGIRYLESMGPDIVRELFGAISGLSTSTNVMRDAIEYADRRNVAEDKKVNGNNSADDLGIKTEAVVVNAMKRLVSERKWLVNEPGARVWYMDEALYVVWPISAQDIADVLGNTPGVPKNKDSILALLIEHEIAEPYYVEDKMSELWAIRPGVLAERSPDIKLHAVRIKNPSLLFTVMPASIPGVVLEEKENLKRTGQEAPAVATTPAATANPPSQTAASAEPAAPESGKPARNAKPKPATATPPPAAPTAAQSMPPAPITEETPAMVQTWFRDNGLVGEILLQLVADLRENKISFGGLINILGSNVCIEYPAGLEGMGVENTQILAAFAHSEWLEIDPYNPVRRIQEIELPERGSPVRVLMLNKDISQKFLVMLVGNQLPDKK